MIDRYMFEITLSNGAVADVYSKCKDINDLCRYIHQRDWSVLETVTDNNDVVTVAYRSTSITSVRQFPIPE